MTKLRSVRRWGDFGDRLFRTDWTSAENDPWLFASIVPRRGRGELIAKKGTGKTFMLSELCLALALGDQAFGRFAIGSAVTNRRSLFLALEDDDTSMLLRFEALLRARGVTELTPALRQAINRNIKVITIEDSGGRFNLQTHFHKLRRWMDDGSEGPALVCADTLARLRGGHDENDAAAMESAIISPLSQLYAKQPVTYLFTHHPPLNAKGEIRGRGSGAIEDSMDFVLAWSGTQFTVTKMRSDNFHYPAVPQPFKLSLDLSVENESASWAVDLDPRVDLNRPSRKILDALRKGGSKSGRLTYAQQKALGLNGTTIREARETLIAKGLAELDGRTTLLMPRR